MYLDVAHVIEDPERLRALRATGLLEHGTVVTGLDRLTRLATRLLDVPAGVVTLIEPDRQVFASHHGLTGELAEKRQTPLSYSFCQYVVADAAPMVVRDARTDERLSGNPAIGEHQAIAYAGFPLRDPDGQVLGSFCVFDGEPRVWTERDVAVLGDLAQEAEAEIALRVSQGQLLLAAARTQAILDTSPDAFISSDHAGRVTAWNHAAEVLFGHATAEALGRPLAELIIPAALREAHARGMARVATTGRSALAGQRTELTAVNRDGREFPVEMSLSVDTSGDLPVFHAFLHDISERRAEQQQLETERQTLAEERSFLQALLDSLDTGVVACGSDGRLRLFNRALREAHDAEEQPLGPEEWARAYRLYGADGRTPLKPEEVPLARAFAGEQVHGEHLVVRPPGRPLTRYVTNARPIDLGDGRRAGAVAAMHDVTAAHRADTLLRCQHAAAAALAEATTAGQAAAAATAAIGAQLGWACAEYWEVDEEREHIVRASSWTRPGLDLSAFTGDGPLSFVRGQGLAGLVWKRGADLWSSRIAAEADQPGRVREGLRAGLVTGIGLPVRSGRRVAGVIAFYLDEETPCDTGVLDMLRAVAAQVSRFVERRRAEDLTLALAAVRRDLDRMIEHVDDYLWTVEVLADGRVESVYASPNGTGVFGAVLPVDADMAAVLASRVHPDDMPLFARFHTTVSGGQPAEVEVRVIGYDDVVRWVWTRATCRNEDGRLFVDGICTNITERRELADQREQHVAQLQRLDRMKDELVAVVSHELRNPVGVIAAYTEELLDDPDLAGRRELNVIARTSAHLLHLVQDLLDLARLDAGHDTIDPRPVTIARLLREAVQSGQPAADAAGVTIVADLAPVPVVDGDAGRLRQVLDNLLSNAVKYTPAGGTVVVSSHDDGNTVTVTVADNGIGIPAEQYPKLFTRFFRASTATSRGIKGTGLGLAVTHAIITAHHGTVIARPRPGGGTEFVVTLPVRAAAV
ncbi:ATP-binding protein [Actinoplanes subglobosus]|uniref:histidine kinase n=1 Tax=Actinoplanes subglobosus TaxID=1547892 RepID=A0ABV8IR11_9ACTN